MSAGIPPGEIVALETVGLGIEIGGRTICRSLSLSFGAAQCWAVLGLNGAGKTTLLHTLAGVRPPQSGEVRLDGRSLARTPRRVIARSIGLLAQDLLDAFDGTVLETTLIGRHPHLSRWHWEGAEDARIAMAALAEVDLDGLAARRVSTLSGGECERLAIAAVLAQQPRVWLLDEPTSHLDAHHQLLVLDLFACRAAEQGRTVVMSLHDASLAARYCTHALLLFEGGEALAGAAASVLTEASLTRLYRHPIREIAADGLRLFVPR
jgi:iron complex transport system ATP-binding protein